MTECVALIRGVNVGNANRLAMGELRTLCGSVGLKNARTVLNSGNVVFTTRRSETRELARSIQLGIAQKFRISTSVAVMTAAELDAIIAAAPLRGVASDPVKHLIAFPATSADLEPLRDLLAQSWTPDALVVERSAAYLWCAAGVLDSPLSKACAKIPQPAFTMRNWNTVLKIQTAAQTQA